MSTTPSTHDRRIPYTVVGHRCNGKNTGQPGVILLNRSSRLVRRDYVAAMVEEGFSEIISVESRNNSYSVEALSSEFPAVRFLLLDDLVSIGTRINLAMRLMSAETVLVMWSTMEPPGSMTRPLESLHSGGLVCVAPSLRNDRGETLPVVQAPALHRRHLRVLTLPVRGRPVETLFPYDFVGLYDRRRFERVFMYDERISSPYWQKMDFGFRVALWGERIRAEPTFRMTYRTLPDPEDQTATGGYERFYARNLAVQWKDGAPGVSRLQAVPFAFRARRSIPEMIRVFGDASLWVQDHADRFRKEPRTLISEWSVDHG